MNTHNETILIVDDEPTVRKLLRVSLSGIGYVCLEAGNYDEGIEQFSHHNIDIALLDITMQGKSGIELLSDIIARYPDTAAIMISAISDGNTAIECMRIGAYDYITKPFNATEVTLRIERALEKRKLKIDNITYQLHLEDKVNQQTQEIRASEENFRNSLDHSPLGIRIVNSDGQALYTNQALLNTYGYSGLEELNSRSNKELHTPESYVAHRERVEKRKRGETIASPYEIDIRRKDGEIRHLLVNRAEVLWNGEKQFQVLYQDITERMLAEKALTASHDQLRQTLGSVIQMIAMIVETRDPYTAGHQRRVAKLAGAIADKLHLSKEETTGIRVAATIHDIGKISVPGEILSKPGKITEMEFNLIKEHSKTGYDILKGIDFPWPVAQAVLQHHERMDGSGYPNKLSSKDIILEAKIIAVADVVEAMASHRPYRPSLGIDAALQEICQGKNTSFDPAVVDACSKVFAEDFKFD